MYEENRLIKKGWWIFIIIKDLLLIDIIFLLEF